MPFKLVTEKALRKKTIEQLNCVPDKLKKLIFNWGASIYLFNEEITPLDYFCKEEDTFKDGRLKMACSFYQTSSKSLILQKEHLILPNQLRTVAKHEFVHALDFYLGEKVYKNNKSFSTQDKLFLGRWRDKKALHAYAQRNPMEYFASIGETFFNPMNIDNYEKQHDGEFTKRELIECDEEIHDYFQSIINRIIENENVATNVNKT